MFRLRWGLERRANAVSDSASRLFSSIAYLNAGTCSSGFSNRTPGQVYFLTRLRSLRGADSGVTVAFAMRDQVPLGGAVRYRRSSEGYHRRSGEWAAKRQKFHI
jgi:hypothetical protein